MKDIITAKEAGKLLNLSERQAIRLIISGHIVGKHLGHQWAISKSSVLAEKARRKAESEK